MDPEFPKKYLKRLPEGFEEAIESAELEEIKQKILASERHVYEIQKGKAQDEALMKAREEVKELAAPYREAQATENAKIQFCLYVLENRGIKV